MTPRRLTLRSERLIELTTDDLRNVAAGAIPTSDCTGMPSYNLYCASTWCLTGTWYTGV